MSIAVKHDEDKKCASATNRKYIHSGPSNHEHRRIHGQYRLQTGGQERKYAFSHFPTQSLPTDGRTDGPMDQLTDGPTDGQSLLESCVSATKQVRIIDNREMGLRIIDILQMHSSTKSYDSGSTSKDLRIVYKLYGNHEQIVDN